MRNKRRALLALAFLVCGMVGNASISNEGGVATVPGEEVKTVETELMQDEKGFRTMERVLYSLPEPDPRLPSAEERIKMTQDEYAAALRKIWNFRQAEVKKAMENMDDPGVLMRNRTAVLMSASLRDENPSALLDTLEELEWAVQDIDDATHFVRIGGVDLCVYLFDHTNAEVRSLAAQTLGSAVKNQPDLQLRALQAGTITRSLNKIESLSPCGFEDSRSKECSKFLYALSSTTRGHEESQREAIQGGLLGMLTSIVESENVAPKVMVKVLSLVSDIFTEWGVDCSAEWTSERTAERMCVALGERAKILIDKYGESLDAEGISKEVAVKLRLAAESAKCITPDLSNYPIFRPLQ